VAPVLVQAGCRHETHDLEPQEAETAQKVRVPAALDAVPAWKNRARVGRPQARWAADRGRV